MGSMKVDGRAIVSAERGSVLSILGQGRTPATVGAIVSDAQSHADWLTEGAKQLIPPRSIACREGCSFCCYLQVITTIPEVLHIATTLRSWTAAEQAALRDRIAAHREVMAGLDRDARRRTRVACPLLRDGLCSVYPIRPMSCRGWNSLDVRVCEADYLDPTQQTLGAIYGPQHEIHIYVQEGMGAGLQASGLQHERVELVAALQVCLDVPDVQDRWLAGQRLFDPAAVR
jgi:hypothetical protein